MKDKKWLVDTAVEELEVGDLVKHDNYFAICQEASAVVSVERLESGHVRVVLANGDMLQVHPRYRVLTIYQDPKEGS